MALASSKSLSSSLGVSLTKLGLRHGYSLAIGSATELLDEGRRDETEQICRSLLDTALTVRMCEEQSVAYDKLLDKLGMCAESLTFLECQLNAGCGSKQLWKRFLKRLTGEVKAARSRGLTWQQIDELYCRALAVRPGDPEVWAKRGMFLLGEGQLHTVAEDLDAIVLGDSVDDRLLFWQLLAASKTDWTTKTEAIGAAHTGQKPLLIMLRALAFCMDGERATVRAFLASARDRCGTDAQFMAEICYFLEPAVLLAGNAACVLWAITEADILKPGEPRWSAGIESEPLSALRRRASRIAVCRSGSLPADEDLVTGMKIYLADFPKDASVVLKLDEVLTKLGRSDERDARLLATLDRVPDHPGLLAVAVRRLTDQLDIETAEALCRRAMTADPRSPSLAKTIASFLLRTSRPEEACQLLREAALRVTPNASFLVSASMYLRRSGYVAEARRFLSNAYQLDPQHKGLGLEDARLTAAEGRVAALSSNSRPADLGSGARSEIEDHTRAELLVRAQTVDILSRIPNPQKPRGVAVLVTQGSPLSLLWKGLVASELRHHGFVPVVLEQFAGVPLAVTGDSRIDPLQGLVTGAGKLVRGETAGQPLRYNWVIDPGREVLLARGMNFFQPIYERIGTIMRRYTVDFSHPLARACLADLIARTDTALFVCDYIQQLTAAQGLQVRFLGSMSHYVPAAVYRLFCAGPGKSSGMEYVAFLAAYQHYYRGLEESYCTALSMANMTKQPDLRMPCHATADQFDTWLERGQDVNSIKLEIDSIVSMDRARRVTSQEAAEIRDRILAHRKKGGKVGCLFGKIMYDICIDEEGGPAHKDMVDWLNHSIDSVRDCEDILLLIKPHPNEIRREVARPTELFTDAIQSQIPENVIKLEHQWFNVGDLLSLIDFGVMWHGTTTLELIAKGIPVVVCAHWGIKDHPIPVIAPSDRENYADLLRSPTGLHVDRATQERAALLIKYLASDEIMIPYDYGRMQVLRKDGHSEPIVWYMENVDRYFENGDPYIDFMARRCL